MKISILFLAFKLVFVAGIQSVDAHAWLTWEAQQDRITFNCKVNQLIWRVSFYDPSNEEQGHCLSPFHSTECFAFNNFISQDQHTNTTVLTIYGSVDTSINGQWKCIHGRNIDKAVVNVTVIKEVVLNDIGNCSEENLAWTFIGCITCALVFLLLWTVHNFNRKLSEWCLYRFPRRKTIRYRDCCEILIVFFVLMSTFFLPFIRGLSLTKCTDKITFMAFGFCVAVICVTFILIREKEKDIELAERMICITETAGINSFASTSTYIEDPSKNTQCNTVYIIL